MIKARSSYIDRRCAYDGTCRTFRYHSECDGLVGRAAAYWGIDDDDDWSEESIWCFVTEYQSDTGLDGTGWPEVPTESGPAS